jgi:hypothetical protein
MPASSACRVFQMEEHNSPDENLYPRDWSAHKRARIRIDVAGYKLSSPENQALPDAIRYLHGASEKHVALLERLKPYSDADELKFKRLAEEWTRATSIHSSLSKKVLHPAYQRIIGMGPAAIPLILKEMRRRPGHWFWALDAITEGQSPRQDWKTLEEATQAWINWGEIKGYL